MLIVLKEGVIFVLRRQMFERYKLLEAELEF